MALTQTEKERLYAHLEAAGWWYRRDIIVSPHQTIWFDRESPWIGTGPEFLSRMRGRLDRILANHHSLVEIDQKAWTECFDDTKSLVECLELAFGSKSA